MSLDKHQKKAIIFGVLGGLVISILFVKEWIFKQVEKFNKNKIGFKNFKVNKVSINETDIDMFMTYDNKADVGITITKQEYDVYLDGVYYTTLKNYIPTTIKPNDISVIGIKMRVNPVDIFNKLKTNFNLLVLNTKQVRMRLDMRFTVKLGIFHATIPYSYEDSMKNMTGI